MSFIGKTLVVVQLAMSIVFMCFAGAVYSTQSNWRRVAQNTKMQVDKLQKDLDERSREFEKYKTDAKAVQNKLEAAATKAEGEKRDLADQVAQLQREKNDLAKNLVVQTELAQIAADDAKVRQEQVLQLRESNKKLAESRDAEFREKVKRENELHAVRIDYEQSMKKNGDLLSMVVKFRQKLEEKGINPDDPPSNLTKTPPPIRATITDTRAPKTQGGSEFVEISVGSDDGLIKGHKLTVYRPGTGSDAKAKYLGRIEIVLVTPDRSVGMLVEKVGNNAITKGDLVTSKF